ncbi:MAG: hypothetical protein Q9217_006792, partial [Psora testacea]
MAGGKRKISSTKPPPFFLTNYLSRCPTTTPTTPEEAMVAGPKTPENTAAAVAGLIITTPKATKEEMVAMETMTVKVAAMAVKEEGVDTVDKGDLSIIPVETAIVVLDSQDPLSVYLSALRDADLHDWQSGGRQGHGGYGGGQQGGYNDNDDDEFGGAVHHAQQHAEGSAERSMFSSALGFLSGNKNRLASEDVDEGQAVNAHQAMYGQGGGGGNHNSGTVGAGAAMQALKMFTGGQGQGMSGGGAGMGAGSMGGGGGQNAFIGMAMAQAGKLFDSQSQSGNL